MPAARRLAERRLAAGGRTRDASAPAAETAAFRVYGHVANALVSVANEAKLPVLMLHGKRDEVIPFALGKDLYDGLRVPKQMFVCENGGHCEIPMVEGSRYYEAVVTFARSAGGSPAG